MCVQSFDSQMLQNKVRSRSWISEVAADGRFSVQDRPHPDRFVGLPANMSLIYLYMCFQWNKYLNEKDIQRIAVEIESENSLFSKKALLDIFALPSAIIGREDKAKEIADSC